MTKATREPTTPAVAMPTEDDAKLIALGRQISALRVLERVADAECQTVQRDPANLQSDDVGAPDQGSSGAPAASSQEEALERYSAADHAFNVISDQMSETCDQNDPAPADDSGGPPRARACDSRALLV